MLGKESTLPCQSGWPGIPFLLSLDSDGAF